MLVVGLQKPLVEFFGFGALQRNDLLFVMANERAQDWQRCRVVDSAKVGERLRRHLAHGLAGNDGFAAHCLSNVLGRGVHLALQGYLQDRGITYLVAEDYIMPSTHPHLAYLIDPDKAPAWLRPVYSATRDGHTLVLYKYE